jgi:hypothetical protein
MSFNVDADLVQAIINTKEMLMDLFTKDAHRYLYDDALPRTEQSLWAQKN